jgi:hypothetical protein
MLLKKSLVLAIDLIMRKERGPKINIGGGVGGRTVLSFQLPVVSKKPGDLVGGHALIVLFGGEMMCKKSEEVKK